MMALESTLPVLSTGTDFEGNVGPDTATSQDQESSKAIKYKLLYRNDAGEPIKEDEQYKPWPKLMTANEEETTGTHSVLGIVTYVTIRQIAVSTPVSSQSSAAAAGTTSTPSGKDAESEPVQSKDLKSQNLEISSIGSTEMVIRSKQLCGALRRLVDYYPSQQLTGAIKVSEPYHFLLHHQGKLRRIMSQGRDGCDDGIFHNLQPERTRSHIRVLLAFLDAKYAKKIEDEEARHRKNPPTATFEMLWMLLKPGTRVYTDVDGELAAFVIRSTRTDRNSNPNWYDVDLWYLDFDGRRIGRCLNSVHVSSFSGEREVSSLKIFPADMASDKALRSRLESAGKRYFDVLRKGSEEVKYDGHSLGKIKRYYKGRVVLDPASFWSYSQTARIPPKIGGLGDDDSGVEGCNCSSCVQNRTMPKLPKWSTYDDIDLKNEKQELTPEHFMLFPRTIMGFVLKTRDWEVLNINHVSRFEPNSNAIKNLVMDDRHRKLVEVLTYKYKDQERDRREAWNADFIRSKGEGQIFLLHGPPGVGKTYTAECIAEMSQRPLLALTCADIGIDEKNMEANLSNWFDLAEIWGAVVLIDEADIYLETRTTSDLQRNSLVSAFLRAMEYYRGILFLTTNRVGLIDDAIMSRVHLVVKYETLKAPAQIRIWKQFVTKLEKDRTDFMVDHRATRYVQDFFKSTVVSWNGREIRNAIQTAVALAEHEAKTSDPPEEDVKLKTVHIEEVIEMSQVFKEYLTSLRGDEARRALQAQARMDKEKDITAEKTLHEMNETAFLHHKV